MRNSHRTDEEANPYEPPRLRDKDAQLPRFFFERILFFGCFIPLCFSFVLHLVRYYRYGIVDGLLLAIHAASSMTLGLVWLWRRRTWNA
jgi:hypothetical protein